MDFHEIKKQALLEYNLTHLSEEEQDKALFVISTRIQEAFFATLHSLLPKEKWEAINTALFSSEEEYAKTLTSLVPNYEQIFQAVRTKVKNQMNQESLKTIS